MPEQKSHQADPEHGPLGKGQADIAHEAQHQTQNHHDRIEVEMGRHHEGRQDEQE